MNVQVRAGLGDQGAAGRPAGAEVGELRAGVDATADSATLPVMPTHLVALEADAEAESTAAHLRAAECRPVRPASARPTPRCDQPAEHATAAVAVRRVRRGIRSALGWQAALLSVIGMPVGVALGRLSWRVVAGHTPLVFAPPWAIATLLLAGPLTLLIANLIATLPGWRASRLRPAEQLRHE